MQNNLTCGKSKCIWQRARCIEDEMELSSNDDTTVIGNDWPKHFFKGKVKFIESK